MFHKPPQKSSSREDLDLVIKHTVLWTHTSDDQSTSQTSSRWIQPFFAALTSVTDRQTDWEHATSRQRERSISVVVVGGCRRECTGVQRVREAAASRSTAVRRRRRRRQPAAEGHGRHGRLSDGRVPRRPSPAAAAVDRSAAAVPASVGRRRRGRGSGQSATRPADARRRRPPSTRLLHPRPGRGAGRRRRRRRRGVHLAAGGGRTGGRHRAAGRQRRGARGQRYRRRRQDPRPGLPAVYVLPASDNCN